MPFRVSPLIVRAVITALLISQMVPIQLHNPALSFNKVSTFPLTPISGAQSTLVVLVGFSDKTNSTSPTRIAGTLSTMDNYYAEDSYGIVSFVTTLSPSVTSPWYSLQKTMEYYSANTASIDNQLVTDSLQAAYKAGVNFHDYKYAIIVHAGNDEAMPPHSSTDIHSFTIPGYVFNPTPLDSFQISTSVVSESDPIGVYAHEAGHLQGLPDLYELTQQIDPVNNFVGYWEIMALGEWNPNNGNPLRPSPGTFPSQHSSWSKIKLGWISNSSIRIGYPAFGPCSSPCVSNNTFSAPPNFVKIIVTTTNSTAYTIIVDRTSSPLLLLQVNTPAPGMLISVDGTNLTSDRSNELRLPVHYGPHQVYIQSQVPLSIGSTTIQVGLTNSFAAWNDGSTANPRWVSVITDTVMAATYRVTVEPSFATAATAAILLAIVVLGITVNRRRSRNKIRPTTQSAPLIPTSSPTVSPISDSLPRNDGLGKDPVKSDQEPNQAHP